MQSLFLIKLSLHNTKFVKQSTVCYPSLCLLCTPSRTSRPKRWHVSFWPLSPPVLSPFRISVNLHSQAELFIYLTLLPHLPYISVNRPPPQREWPVLLFMFVPVSCPPLNMWSNADSCRFSHHTRATCCGKVQVPHTLNIKQARRTPAAPFKHPVSTNITYRETGIGLKTPLDVRIQFVDRFTLPCSLPPQIHLWVNWNVNGKQEMLKSPFPI